MSGRDEETRYRDVLALDPERPETLDGMISALYDESWRVRRAATEGLARRRDHEAALEKLLTTLADQGQTGARNAAAEAMVRFGERAVPVGLRLLAHPDPDQRKFAAEILGAIRSRDAVPALVTALSDSDLNVSVVSAEALGQLGGEEASRALVDALPNAPELLKLSILEALAQLESPPPLPVLTPFLHDARLRRSAYRVLALIPQPAAATALARGLGDPSPAVREAAHLGIGRQTLRADRSSRAMLEAAIRSEAAEASALADDLGRLLEDERREARAGALMVSAALPAHAQPHVTAIAEAAGDDALFEEVVHTLSRHGPSAGRLLISQLGALSMSARSATLAAVSQLADPSLIPELVALLEIADVELQPALVSALGKVHAREAIPPLLARLDDRHVGVEAGRALVTLAQSLHDEVVRALLEALETHPTGVATDALSAVDPQAVLPLLPKLVRSSSAEVRAAAMGAARGCQSEECFELCRMGLGDEDRSVRRAAVKTLAGCIDARVEGLLRHALEDEDLTVQSLAIEAAGQRRCVGLTAELERRVGSKYGSIASSSLRALARMGAVHAAVLDRARQHPDAEVLKEALLAGAALKEGIPLALEELGHPRWDVRLAAAQLLATSGGEGQRARLETALATEEDPLVVEALKQALSRVAPSSR